MKKISFLFFLAALMTAPLGATTFRVNNSPGSNAPYSTFQDAQAVALDGDTIIVEPSATSYGTILIEKQLTIAGNGYLHTIGSIPYQENSNNSTFDNIIINSPCTLYGLVSLSSISRFYAISNVTVSRCRTFGGIDILGDNNIIRQNYAGAIYAGGNNLQITNNIVASSIIFYPNTTALVENNVFGFDVLANYNNVDAFDFNNAFVIFRNNILIHHVTFEDASFVTFDNNMAENYGDDNNVVSPFPEPSSNILVYSFGFLVFSYGDSFVEPYSDSDSFENYGELSLTLIYDLQDNGYYGNGDDIGIFNNGVGRPTYQVKGIPPFPTIFYLNTGYVTGNTLPVTISTRANN